MGSTSALLISELEAIDGWPPERWSETLDQITKLFLLRADNLAADQISLFDDVFVRLIDRVGTPSLSKLSRKLSEAKCTLPKSARRLAFHDDESVSIPFLKSARLTPELILDVAQSGGLKQRLAVARRHSVDLSVSEALIQSGEAAIYHALADNLGAKLSESDWAWLVQISESDPNLTQKLGRRSDMPSNLRRKIHAKLGDARMRELQAMPQMMRDQIESTIAAAEARKMPADSASPDYARLRSEMAELNRKGKLGDSTVNRFAVRGEYTNVVAALAFLAGSPVEVIQQLIASENIEGLVLACKASRLDWATAAQIVKNRPDQPPVSATELEKAKKTFETFSLSAAQRTIRF
jgi:uncharacterized protein (DUF2336 family)